MRTFFHKNSMFGARSPPTPTRAPPHPYAIPLHSDPQLLQQLLLSSSLLLQHLLPSPHYRPLEYPGSPGPAQPESTSYDPHESSLLRIRVAQSSIRVEKQ